MKRFKFKLASIKHIRESEEKEALDVYATHMQTRNNWELRVDELNSRLLDSQRQIVAKREAASSAGDLLAEHNSMLAIRQQIDEAQKALDESLKQEAEAREVFLAAKAGREILDRLESKQKDEFELEQRRREEQETEDVVMARHGRSVAI